MDSAARIGVAIVALGTVAGAVAIAVADRFRPDLQAWVAQDPRTRLRVVIIAVTVFTAGPVMVVARYLWTFGRHVRAERPGDRRGVWMQAYAAVVGVAGLLLAFFLLRLLP